MLHQGVDVLDLETQLVPLLSGDENANDGSEPFCHRGKMQSDFQVSREEESTTYSARWGQPL